MQHAPHAPNEAPLPPYSIRPIETQDEYREAEQIQREVWGIDDLDVVPSEQLRAVRHAGGCLLGAFREEVLIGLAYGFLSLPHGGSGTGLGLHSHLLAVRKQARAAGVGRALKWHQRDWALARGIDWITWTFDPLQARNARLNLEHLGAVAFEYLRDFYGPLAGPLGGGQPSDRLLALWRLRSERVVQRAERWRMGTTELGAELVREQAAYALPFTSHLERDAAPAMVHREPWIVRAVGGGVEVEPEVGSAPPDAPTVRVAIPADVTTMLHVAPERVTRWRNAVAAAMTQRLENGYAVTGFRDGGYVLERDLDK